MDACGAGFSVEVGVCSSMRRWCLVFLRPTKKVGASTEYVSVAQAFELVARFQRIPGGGLRIMSQGFETKGDLLVTLVFLAGVSTDIVGQIEEQFLDFRHVAL
jgi:hypothetical protein